ncbi:hypothetical protein Z949_2873 [Sulfitobacter guttiformis KCTC 32187]|nr:hypothetical protein Z949_2873 [Sulfitobacter guttiformis KCTC 32187]
MAVQSGPFWALHKKFLNIRGAFIADCGAVALIRVALSKQGISGGLSAFAQQ